MLVLILGNVVRSSRLLRSRSAGSSATTLFDHEPPSPFRHWNGVSTPPSVMGGGASS